MCKVDNNYFIEGKQRSYRSVMTFLMNTTCELNYLMFVTYITVVDIC